MLNVLKIFFILIVISVVLNLKFMPHLNNYSIRNRKIDDGEHGDGADPVRCRWSCVDYGIVGVQ